MFIKLTKMQTGKPWLVNTRHVAEIEEGDDGVVRVTQYKGGTSYAVTQTITEVCYLLGGNVTVMNHG